MLNVYWAELSASDQADWQESADCVGSVVVIDQQQQSSFRLLLADHVADTFHHQLVVLPHVILIGIANKLHIIHIQQKQIHTMLLDGYFNAIELAPAGYPFVAVVTSASELILLDPWGSVFRHFHHLAVDGVLVSEITAQKIVCECELDPPDGWQECVVEWA